MFVLEIVYELLFYFLFWIFIYKLKGLKYILLFLYTAVADAK